MCPLGGAPNYYPNSFSAPEIQPQCVESKFKVSPDVARYNSSDEDNVTQVGIYLFFYTISQLSFGLTPVGYLVALVSLYTSGFQDFDCSLCLSSQVRTFYTQVLTEEERQRLCQNFAGSLKGAQLFIQRRMVSSHDRGPSPYPGTTSAISLFRGFFTCIY